MSQTAKSLYQKLVKQLEDSLTVSQYKLHSTWVMGHIDRICREFSFLEVGKPVKFTMDGITRVSILRGIILAPSYMNAFVGIDTGFGNIWYYEAKEPTKAELKKFDGHCLIFIDEDEDQVKDEITELSSDKMNIRTHLTAKESVAGTSLAGEIKVPYKKLVKLLGKPNAEGDTYKTDAEWEIVVNEKVMTIYNYKDGKNYNGRNGIATTKLTDWHIGGREDLTKEIAFLETKLSEIK